MNVMADLFQFLCLFKAGLRTSLAVPTEQLWNKQLLSYSRYPLSPADTESGLSSLDWGPPISISVNQPPTSPPEIGVIL